MRHGAIIFEYTIPRIGDRIDVACIINGIIFALEFKVNNTEYLPTDEEQVVDYALDLKYFHEESEQRHIVPMLIATDAAPFGTTITIFEDKILDTILCNKDNIAEKINAILRVIPRGENVTANSLLLAPCPNENCIISICNTPEFFSYVINANFNSCKGVINYFSQEDNCARIERIIDSEPSFNKKVILLRIFYEILSHSEKVHEYKSLISKNFSRLDTQAIYDFTFCKWLEPTQQDISGLLSEALSLYRSRNSGIRAFPDKLELKLECIYILHITDIIKELNELDELCEDYPHLHFLLHPETFDYKKVDFSNYMWENFARREKYMAEFVEHRDDIIPSIKDHIRSRIATDVEKKILYGFLLRGDEIWEKE